MIKVEQSSEKDAAESKIDTVNQSNVTSLPDVINDDHITENESLIRDCDTELLFQQIPLPDKLLQSEDRDGEDDSNSASGTQQTQNTIKLAVEGNEQDQNEVIFSTKNFNSILI